MKFLFPSFSRIGKLKFSLPHYDDSERATSGEKTAFNSIKIKNEMRNFSTLLVKRAPFFLPYLSRRNFSHGMGNFPG